MNWIALTSESQLKDIIANSEQPVMIFKHSTRCSISATALNRLERNWNDMEVAPLKAYYLDLLSYRPVSNQIASTLNVTHQSPQLLLIHQGKCVYNASHMDISYPELKRQLERVLV
jgi:bacillithiol system protein YtxJ